MDIGDTAIKGMDYFYSLGPQYMISQTVLVASSCIAIFTRNEWFHAIFVVTLLVYLVSQGFLIYSTVG
jgi:hypothetical protein